MEVAPDLLMLTAGKKKKLKEVYEAMIYYWNLKAAAEASDGRNYVWYFLILYYWT